MSSTSGFETRNVYIYSRRLAGAAIAVIGLPLLTVVLDTGRDVIELPSVLLVYLVAVIAIATIGGTLVGVGSALAAFALSNFYFIEPTGTLQIDDPDHFVALVVFLTAAITVSTIVGVATRRSDEAHRARAEAEALARSSASLVTEADPVPAVLEHLRLALGARAARLETHSGETWQITAAAGIEPSLPLAGSGDEAPQPVVVDLDATNRLIVIGKALTADDRRLVSSFGNQLVAGLRARASQHDAETAERLTAVDELRTGLLRAVSHDLRTPLATIKASVSGLLSDDVEWPDAERAELLHAIDDETDRLDGIIGNLLDMSRLEAGVLAARRSPVAVDDVVAAALASLTGVESGSVIVSIDPELPQVVADAALLERALANLVSNAITASRGRGAASGPVTVEAGLVSADRLDVRVVDRGPGLPEDDRLRLFEPFQRLDDRGGPKGLGLGLAIARRFVDSMGGELVLDDTPGGGVTATIRLQVAQ
jgi:two-component system sensor histidine kinase KdpD